MEDDLGIAWLVKRLVVSKILKSKPAPDINDVDNVLIEANTAGRLVWSSMVPAIVRKIVGTGPLESEMAVEYAHRLGIDLDAVSSKALKQGYNASLGKGIDRSLSWARVAEAWGLDGAQMRSFIGTMPKADYSGDVIPPRSKVALETMINTRADRIRDNETYAMNQLAQQVHWVRMRETGEVGPDITKQWHTALDERTCKVCAPINNKIVRVDKHFSRGVFAPPVHPRCRCWVELLDGPTVVTKRDYKRDEDGKFSRVNTLGFDMSKPEGHPFGRDTYGRPRPSRAEITRMQKETKPLKTGKGGYDIVGGYTEGAHPFGLPGMSLVPTRDEKYYQMQYRDWFDKKTEHDLFSPDEYYARTWALGIPYKHPKEDEIFTEEERINRAAKFKEIEDRWNDNVKRANAEGRTPDMPSYEDLATYWHWDPEWATAAGRWEGKYREFHPSGEKKDIRQHRMYNELAMDQKFIDESKKKLPPYEGLRRDGKKISYTPLPKEWDDEFGLNPHNYPYRRVTTDSDAWKKFESDFITREAAITALKEDPEIVNLIDREDRAREGAKIYRDSKKVNTLVDVYNSGSARNAERLPINPKKYQQGYRLRRLREDIQHRDEEIRQRVNSTEDVAEASPRLPLVSKNLRLVDNREYNRDEDGRFARVNTLVPEIDKDRTDWTQPSPPKTAKVIPLTPAPAKKQQPVALLTPEELKQIEYIVSGKKQRVVNPKTTQEFLASEQVRRDRRTLLRGAAPSPQRGNAAVLKKAEEVSQIIYDSKVRAGLKPQKRPPRYINFDMDKTISVAVEPIVIETPMVLYVDKAPSSGTISFKDEPVYAYDPSIVPDEEMVKDKVMIVITGLTMHPMVRKEVSPLGVSEIKVNPSVGVAAGTDYEITSRSEIKEDDSVEDAFTAIFPIGLRIPTGTRESADRESNAMLRSEPESDLEDDEEPQVYEPDDAEKFLRDMGEDPIKYRLRRMDNPHLFLREY